MDDDRTDHKSLLPMEKATIMNYVDDKMYLTIGTNRPLQAV